MNIHQLNNALQPPTGFQLGVELLRFVIQNKECPNQQNFILRIPTGSSH